MSEKEEDVEELNKDNLKTEINKKLEKKREKRGFFGWIAYLFRKMFGIKTKEEKLAEEQAKMKEEEEGTISEHEQEIRDLEKATGIYRAPEGYDDEKKTEGSPTETKKSGSSPMVVVPSSDVAKKTTETAEPSKTEETAEEETEKSK